MMAALVDYAHYATVVLIVLGVLLAQLIWLLVITVLLMVSRGRLDTAHRAIKRLNADVKIAGRMRRDRLTSEPVTTPEIPEPTAALGTLSRLFPPPVPVPLPVPTPPAEVAWRAEPVVPTNPIRQQPLRPNGRHSATDQRESRAR